MVMPATGKLADDYDDYDDYDVTKTGEKRVKIRTKEYRPKHKEL
jgi:hypothetical protein